VPRKNVRVLRGKPLLAHAIEAAQGSELVDRVVVSTDDAEIGRVAQRYGARVVWRPKEISGDAASSEQALLHALDYMREVEQYTPPITVFLQCTSPTITPADIDGTIRALLETESDSALAVAPFHHFLWRFDGALAAGINHESTRRLLRQEAAPQYLETGAVYVMRTAGFLQSRHRFFGRTTMYVSTGPQVEIDDPPDFEVAEALLAFRERNARISGFPPVVGALVLDFDGVLTDNRVIVSEDGKESVICSRSDGHALSCLKLAGLPVTVLSAERNSVVKARCAKLGISCLQGVTDKLEALRGWCAEQNLDLSTVVYVGNDEADVPCLRAAGAGVAVADAHPSAISAASLVLHARGGEGAVREIYDLLWATNKETEREFR
jgi:YrbI family 3-deoxy-D-manno-octulosonate 8-phosphate phosphatase